MIEFTFDLMDQMLELTDCPDYWKVNFDFLEYWSSIYPHVVYVDQTYGGVFQNTHGGHYRFDILNFPVELYTTDGKVITLSRTGEISVGENNSR